jgi:ribosomal protein S18 acetylase RimI-like enzyme
VTIGASPDDRRVRRVRLTAAGVAERGELDRRSHAIAQSALEPLTETQRARLVAAMADVERLLRASMVRFAVEDPASRDARWCIGQYFRELDSRFDTGFDASRSIPADIHELTPPAGALILGRLRGQPVGYGALKFHAGAPAELKRMWVARDARGLGIGRRLLRVLEEHARDAGVHVVRLETNRALKEAIELYRSAGYTEVAAFSDEPYAHHWFEKRLSASRGRRRSPQ